MVDASKSKLGILLARLCRPVDHGSPVDENGYYYETVRNARRDGPLLTQAEEVGLNLTQMSSCVFRVSFTNPLVTPVPAERGHHDVVCPGGYLHLSRPNLALLSPLAAFLYSHYAPGIPVRVFAAGEGLNLNVPVFGGGSDENYWHIFAAQCECEEAPEEVHVGDHRFSLQEPPPEGLTLLLGSTVPSKYDFLYW